MIGYITIGALNLEKSAAFYDALLGAIGYQRTFLDGGWAGYAPPGEAEPKQMVYLCAPHDGQPARAGNGIMIGFSAPDRAAVDAAYAAGLAAGGTDEGAPGPRPADSETVYAAYVRDPVGNKLAVVWVKA
jgi:catechol 2,3-dioxygenase-like lactoylglutathione lyase family enzyme